MALLVPLPEPERQDRIPGRWSGRVWYSDDWDVSDESAERDWYDGEIFPK